MANNKVKQLVLIGVEHIHPHPENPRKELGDLTELAESIKKNGVMQNLTVVPIEGQPGEYYALIGNRRHGASMLAGIAEVPCKIVEGMSRREQLSTMLEENMQRSDLTVYEQAQGFQMMLDLGETEESIAEKTGFSKTTIRHRLQIAKLDKDVLKEKTEDGTFQINLTHIMALEKIPDVETRDKILKEANKGEEILSRVNMALAAAARKKNGDELVCKLEALGVKKAPDKISTEIYYETKWKIIKEYYLEKEIPEKLDNEIINETEELFYYRQERILKVVKKVKVEKKELSEQEKAKKEAEKRKKEINAKGKEMLAIRQEFLKTLFEGKNMPNVKNETEIQKKLWRVMLSGYGYNSYNSIAGFFTKDGYYKASEEEKLEADKKMDTLSVTQQMLIAALSFTDKDLADYSGHYNADSGKVISTYVEALEEYGFCFYGDEEKALLNGTHELYVKEEKQEK